VRGLDPTRFSRDVISWSCGTQKFCIFTVVVFKLRLEISDCCFYPLIRLCIYPVLPGQLLNEGIRCTLTVVVSEGLVSCLLSLQSQDGYEI
jgi:hypothetical protein